MTHKPLLMLLALLGFGLLLHVYAQHEDVPYENVTRICESCVCLSAQDANKHFHSMLNCAVKNFHHILARWPAEFGKYHNGLHIEAIFSGNSIDILQQLPATTASLAFTCRHCGIKHLQAPAFMDVPHIKRVDLSWNELTTDELTPDVFRGPFRTTHYEPIDLLELDLSHNQLRTLDRKLFEHTPNLTQLHLSHNKLDVVDSATTMALTTIGNTLELLDLSYTGIKTVPPALFKALLKLRVLNLAGNELIVVPDALQLIGRSLEALNLAGNRFTALTEQSFLGLKSIRSLNISALPALKTIEKGTFARLETLEYLDCSHNSQLELFDLDSLMHASNLTQLDVSYCALTTLTLNMNLSPILASNNRTNTTALPRPWSKLHYLETAGNPWRCDCELLQTLEFAGAHHQRQEADMETRCDTPYLLAGARLSNLTAALICSLQIPKKYTVVDEDPPRFLRKRYIILTAITATVVVVLGLLIGFLVVCIRRRLQRDDFGVEPIRYTSVRSSNLSAFSHVNANGGYHA